MCFKLLVFRSSVCFNILKLWSCVKNCHLNKALKYVENIQVTGLSKTLLSSCSSCLWGKIKQFICCQLILSFCCLHIYLEEYLLVPRSNISWLSVLHKAQKNCVTFDSIRELNPVWAMFVNKTKDEFEDDKDVIKEMTPGAYLNNGFN